jgi:hypothetical protein
VKHAETVLSAVSAFVGCVTDANNMSSVSFPPVTSQFTGADVKRSLDAVARDLQFAIGYKQSHVEVFSGLDKLRKAGDAFVRLYRTKLESPCHEILCKVQIQLRALLLSTKLNLRPSSPRSRGTATSN